MIGVSNHIQRVILSMWARISIVGEYNPIYETLCVSHLHQKWAMGPNPNGPWAPKLVELLDTTRFFFWSVMSVGPVGQISWNILIQITWKFRISRCPPIFGSGMGWMVWVPLPKRGYIPFLGVPGNSLIKTEWAAGMAGRSSSPMVGGLRPGGMFHRGKNTVNCGLRGCWGWWVAGDFCAFFVMVFDCDCREGSFSSRFLATGFVIVLYSIGVTFFTVLKLRGFV